MQGYRLSKEAQDDLKEIKNYSRMVWGNKQTQEYLSEIKNSLRKADHFPGARQNKR